MGSDKLIGKKEQELITALHIMQSVIDNPQDEFKELHEKRIREFYPRKRKRCYINKLTKFGTIFVI